jgi:hypothetical protein
VDHPAGEIAVGVELAVFGSVDGPPRHDGLEMGREMGFATEEGDGLRMSHGPMVQEEGFVLQDDPTGALLDLNLAVAEEVVCLTDEGIASKRILSTADDRLNKESMSVSGAKGSAKGVARFAAPLKKSLLCGQIGRSKSVPPKKSAGSDLGLNNRKGAELANWEVWCSRWTRRRHYSLCRQQMSWAQAHILLMR